MKLTRRQLRNLIMEVISEDTQLRSRSNWDGRLDLGPQATGPAIQRPDTLGLPGAAIAGVIVGASEVGAMTNPNAKYAFPVPVSSASATYLPANRRAGSLNRPDHTGDDWQVGHGTPVIAVATGPVTVARMNPPQDNSPAGRCGCQITLNITGLGEVTYCHLSAIAVRRGQIVQKGETIGLSGGNKDIDPRCAGSSTGPHLHFSLGGSNDSGVYDAFYAECTGYEGTAADVSPGGGPGSVEEIPPGYDL
tara:strand:+ start:72 stop:818 length:747 start_codon:yes stop_codon:yes gene_type:complete